MGSCPRTLPIWALALVVCGQASAGMVVSFTDGRSLRVEAVEVAEEQVRLSIEGGGTMMVPAWRVAGWEAHDDRVAAQPAARPAGTDESWRRAAGAFADPIAQAAHEYELDPALLTAMAQVESALDPAAVSPKGAQGLLQLMPATAERFGVGDVFDATQNVEGGARYLKWLLQKFEGRTDLALAGYNAGEAAVDRHQGIPPYPETRNYVRRVMARVARLGGTGAPPTLAANAPPSSP